MMGWVRKAERWLGVGPWFTPFLLGELYGSCMSLLIYISLN